MRTITKGVEPPSLVQHRLTRHSDYDNYADKAALREVIVREQRGLCCYCMRRIHSDTTTMKIEHWRCQSRYPTEQLNYRNLLAACLGGEGRPPYLQHCDTKKGNDDILWNPANHLHHIETRLRYEPDGTIRSDDPMFDSQLKDVLNLNLSVLKNNRAGVLDGVLGWWRLMKAKLKGPVPRARFERERDRWLPQTGELKPYCQVVISWLDQRLKRMST